MKEDSLEKFQFFVKDAEVTSTHFLSELLAALT